jgi:hypothetical protein
MNETKLLTIHLYTSRSIYASDEECMPFITVQGVRTFEISEAVTSVSREYLESLAEKFNLNSHEFGIDYI